MMDNESQFWKRFLIFTVLLFVFIFAYELFLTTYFNPKQTEIAKQTVKEQKKEEYKNLNVPQLMLGTFREKQEYKDKVSVKLGEYSLEIAKKIINLYIRYL